MKSKHFRPYERDQSLLLPPNLNDWLPEDHLVFFIRDVVDRLDLRPILADCEVGKGGCPPYDPRMMAGLLFYAYCVGVPSSRKIERGTHESVPFRVIAADQHPDHDTIAEKEKDRGDGPPPGRKPTPPSEEPDEKKQRNFTDPDSRIMKVGATKSFEQCCNAEAAVDADRRPLKYIHPDNRSWPRGRSGLDKPDEGNLHARVCGASPPPTRQRTRLVPGG